MLVEPLTPSDARELLRSIVVNGSVTFSQHARQEMAKDRLGEVDALNALRGGVVEPAELENGSWRYRVRTGRMFFVVAFRNETQVVVVTAWRLMR